MNDQTGPQGPGAALAPARAQYDSAQPSSSGPATTRRRRLFVLSGREELTGAATAAWGVLGLEGPDVHGGWESHLSRVPLADDSGLWEERFDGLARAGRAVGPEVIEYWSETANGVIWEIDELEVEDVPDADELADAVEAFVDELLAQPLASPGEEPRDGGPPAY